MAGFISLAGDFGNPISPAVLVLVSSLPVSLRENLSLEVARWLWVVPGSHPPNLAIPVQRKLPTQQVQYKCRNWVLLAWLRSCDHP